MATTPTTPKPPAPWSLLKKRLDGPDRADPLMEFEMPIAPLDHEGRDAWCEHAAGLGAEFHAPGYVRTDPKSAGVSWNFPLVPRMKKALAQAEERLKKTRPDKRGPLARIVADLRSYRDVGRSHGAVLHDARVAEWEAQKAERAAAKRQAANT